MEKAKHTFGRRLRLIRKARGLTLEELGKAASLGYKHVADIERAVKMPSFDAIDRLAHALKVEPYQFFLTDSADNADLDQSLKELSREIGKHSQAGVKRCVVNLLSLLRQLETNVSARKRADISEAIEQRLILDQPAGSDAAG
jgi:transcriptional regulator with XRE-family HTH domain